MTTITLTIPDEFARELDSFDLLEILKMGWVYYQTKQTLKTRKIIAPSRRVRPKRHKVDPLKWEQALLASSDKPVADPHKPRILGLHRGAISISSDFDEPLPDEFWLGEA